MLRHTLPQTHKHRPASKQHCQFYVSGHLSPTDKPQWITGLESHMTNAIIKSKTLMVSRFSELSARKWVSSHFLNTNTQEHEKPTEHVNGSSSSSVHAQEFNSEHLGNTCIMYMVIAVRTCPSALVARKQRKVKWRKRSQQPVTVSQLMFTAGLHLWGRRSMLTLPQPTCLIWDKMSFGGNESSPL